MAMKNVQYINNYPICDAEARKLLENKEDKGHKHDEYATEAYVQQIFNNIDINDFDMSDYVTKDELEDAMKDINVDVDLSDYATKDDLKNYVTKDELNNAIDGVKDYVNEQIADADPDIDLSDYAKKTDIPTKVSQLENDAEYISYYDICLKDEDGNYVVDENGNYIVEDHVSRNEMEEYVNSAIDGINVIEKSSILSVCTVVNNEIRDQDDIIQNWFNEALGEYYIPADIHVYLSKTINIPKHNTVRGGGQFHVATPFTGDTVLTVERRVVLDNVYIINRNPDLKTMLTIPDESVDVRIVNSHFMSYTYCERLIEIGQANNIIMTGCEFEYLDNDDTSHNGLKVIGIEFTETLHHVIIHHNIFLCDNNVTYDFTAIKIDDALIKYCNFDGNVLYMDEGIEGNFIKGEGELFKVSISNNVIDAVPTFTIISLDGCKSVDSINVSNNTGSLGGGYFIYSGTVEVNNSLIVGNNIHKQEDSSIVDLSGANTLLANNCIVGKWWGQDGNECVALNNLNANLSGVWNSKSAGNINTL